MENLECSIVGCSDIEDQQHLLQCKPLLQEIPKKSYENISYHDDFSNVKKQKQITNLYINLLDIRNNLLEEQRNRKTIRYNLWSMKP